MAVNEMVLVFFENEDVTSKNRVIVMLELSSFVFIVALLM